jgi:hypothetical protein
VVGYTYGDFRPTNQLPFLKDANRVRDNYNESIPFINMPSAKVDVEPDLVIRPQFITFTTAEHKRIHITTKANYLHAD